MNEARRLDWLEIVARAALWTVLASLAFLWVLTLLSVPLAQTRSAIPGLICVGGLALFLTAGKALHRLLPPEWLLACALCVPLLVVTRVHPRPGEFLLRLSWALLLPGALLLVLRPGKGGRRFRMDFGVRRGPSHLRQAKIGFCGAAALVARKKRALAASVFSLCLVTDLLGHLSQANLLREGFPHPHALYGVSTLAREPIAPRTRAIAPQLPHWPMHQVPRYLPLLEHRAYTFTAPRLFSGERPDFAAVRAGWRWNSFILPKTYFELIHSSRTNEELRKLFAIGDDWFQFQGEGGYSFLLDDYTYDDFRLTIATKSAGKLYWADGFDSAWRVSIGGREVTVQCAGDNFKAISLPAGMSELHIRYRPWGFITALLVFYGVSLLAGLFSLTFWARASPRSSR